MPANDLSSNEIITTALLASVVIAAIIVLIQRMAEHFCRLEKKGSSGLIDSSFNKYLLAISTSNSAAKIRVPVDRESVAMESVAMESAESASMEPVAMESAESAFCEGDILQESCGLRVLKEQDFIREYEESIQPSFWNLKPHSRAQ